jgi:methylenetetrahydrofolate dehydrogenase (NADP+) / methenyltetrahydrofolate cyclohydrolase
VTAVVIDGNALARNVYADLTRRVAALDAAGIRPGLAAVQVGDNPASTIYVGRKVKACTAIGVHSEVHKLAEDATEAELLALVARLNQDVTVHGILVQLPLPRHMHAETVTQAIAVEKDVDGFTHVNLGGLLAGRALFAPCTPSGVMALLDHYRIAMEGRHAVVIGRSNEVGKPMSLLLVNRGATVTVCNSKTPDLAGHTRRADILVVAAGKPALVTRDMVKEGAAVIDVGINRLPDGKICGDVDYAGALTRAGYITPVPGGVGPMTVALLIANTVIAAERRLREK